MAARSKLYLILAVVAAAIASHVLSGGAAPEIPALNAYYYDVLIGIGINIILAVGLNLVNGYTGQFSLGHAGFMAAGAYASSWLTLSYGYALGSSGFATTTIFLLALLMGGGDRGPRGLDRRGALAALERGLPRDRDARLQ